ncbi:MAG: 2-hydroxyacyl-CoA dehydratase subunit D [Candidatus Hodarchaeales archaeon]
MTANSKRISDPSQKKRSYRKLKSSKEIKKSTVAYYRNSKILPKIPFLRKKVAWLTSGAPVEPVIAAGVIPLYPENYAAILGAAKTSVKACQVAEKAGYSSDLCSYARCHLGTVFDPENSIMRGLTRPDFIVSCNNICGTVVKWWQAISEYYEVPMYHFDTPPITGDKQEEHVFDYVREQFNDYTTFIETMTGKKISPIRMQKTLELSNKAIQLWQDILESCRAIPSPLNCADRFLAMPPVVSQRGVKSTVNVYTKVLKEVRSRVDNGIGAIKYEKTRLLWDNIAIWFYLYSLFNKLAEKGVVFPVDTYTHAWSGKIVGKDPYDALSRIYSHVYLNQDLSYRVKLISRLIKDYSIDGFVLHSNRSCKRYSMGMLAYKKAITEKTGVPGIIIDGDMVDSRNFSEEQTWTRIEGFLELVEARKT